MTESNNVELYKNFKNKISKITNDLLADDRLDELCEQNLKEFKSSFERDYFHITLVSGFQSGKSTTSNVIAGGIEVSPTGEGAKTSACIIQLVPIKKDEKEEAVVFWKSKNDILDYIKMNLPALNIKDIDNPQDFSAFKNLLNSKKQQYYDKLDERDHLQILDIIAKHYEHFKDKPVREKMTIEQAQRMVKFPAKFNSRDANDLTKEEAAFVFIKMVEFYTHSQELLEQGVVFVDCPGIGVNDYDTQLTTNILKERSDAVVYILGSNKTMNKQDKDYLYNLNELKLNDYTFIAVNVTGMSLKQREKLFEENDKSNLSQILKLREGHVGFYQARLALFSKLYNRINALTPFEIESLYEKAKNAYDEEDLPSDKKEAVRYYIQQMIIDDYKTYKKKNSTEEQLDTLIKEDIADWNSFYHQVLSFIVQNKIRAKLSINGSAKLKQIINDFCERLKQKEAEAQVKEEEAKKELEKAKKDLDIFYNDIKQIVKNIEAIYVVPTEDELNAMIDEKIDFNTRVRLQNKYSLFMRGYEELLKIIENKAESFIRELHNNILTEIDKKYQNAWQGQKIAQFLKEDYIPKEFARWINTLINNFIYDYQKELLNTPINKIEIKSLLDKYNKFRETHKSLLDQTYFEDYKLFDESDESIELFKSTLNAHRVKDKGILGWATGSAIAFGIDMIFPGIGTLGNFALGAICGFLGVGVGSSCSTKDDLCTTFSPENIKTLIMQHIKSHDVIKILQEIVIALNQKIGNEFIQKLNDDIEQMRNELITYWNKKEEGYKKAEEERRKIAAHATDVRKKLVEPVQKEINDIVADIERSFPQLRAIS